MIGDGTVGLDRPLDGIGEICRTGWFTRICSGRFDDRSGSVAAHMPCLERTPVTRDLVESVLTDPPEVSLLAAQRHHSPPSLVILAACLSLDEWFE